MANPPKYGQRSINYVQRAVRLRRKLSNKALAHRTGLPISQIENIACGRRVVSREAYYARLNARQS